MEVFIISLTIEIQEQKPKQYPKDIKIKTPEDVYNIEEVQQIKNASQEHFLLIGLDNTNNIKNINLVGIGSSTGISLDRKDLLRTTLVNGNHKIIMVHNHPSNSMKASEDDKKMTNQLNKLFRAFNIELLDHVIVSEKGHFSMMNEKLIDQSFLDENIEIAEKLLLESELNKTKKQLNEFLNNDRFENLKKELLRVSKNTQIELLDLLYKMEDESSYESKEITELVDFMQMQNKIKKEEEICQ